MRPLPTSQSKIRMQACSPQTRTLPSLENTADPADPPFASPNSSVLAAPDFIFEIVTFPVARAQRKCSTSEVNDIARMKLVEYASPSWRKDATFSPVPRSYMTAVLLYVTAMYLPFCENCTSLIKPVSSISWRIDTVNLSDIC